MPLFYSYLKFYLFVVPLGAEAQDEGLCTDMLVTSN